MRRKPAEIFQLVRRHFRRIVIGAVLVGIFLHLLFLGGMAPVLFHIRDNNPEYGSLMLYRERYFNTVNKPLVYTPLKELPPGLVKMVISTEDYHFYEHAGVDVEAMRRALIINWKVGYRMYGGSTITQQLARTLFLTPGKFLLRKYLELLISLEMEVILGKDRILELYLNYAEWGKGVYGIGAAAQHYYQRDVNQLNVDQIARLIALLANPVTYNPETLFTHKLLSNRYYMIKFRYYTYLKFNQR